MATTATPSTQAAATGRHRTSVARANLTAGTGKITVNGKEYDDYFTTLAQRNMVLDPLLTTENHKKVDIVATAKGGGLVGQAGALRLAVSRALTLMNPELRAPLKSKGLMTRDSRMKERKKAGQPGARKRFQFSKR